MNKTMNALETDVVPTHTKESGESFNVVKRAVKKQENTTDASF